MSIRGISTRARQWIRERIRGDAFNLYARVSQGHDGKWRWKIQFSPGEPHESDTARAVDPAKGFATAEEARTDLERLLYNLRAGRVEIIFDEPGS